MRFLEHLPHITAVMSERSDGPMGTSAGGGEFAESRERFLRGHGFVPEGKGTIMAGLVNRDRIAVVSYRRSQSIVPETDGLVSSGPAVAIASQDCFPLFFAPLDPSDGHVLVGIAHAGWRGAVNGIVRKMVTELELGGIDRCRNLAVAIGPGIRQCCFLVRDDEHGLDQYLDHGYGEFAREAGAGADGEKRWRVDLPGILRSQLEVGLSIPSDRIHEAPECTYCGPERFFSWRRDHVEGANMLSAIRLNAGRLREASVR